MSNVVTAEPALQAVFISCAVAIGVGVALAAPAGVFRNRSVLGPDRLLAGVHPLRSISAVTMVGLVVWLMTQSVLVAEKMRSLSPEHRGNVLAHLSAGEFVRLMTIPAIVGVIALVVGDVIAGGARVTRAIGYGLRGLSRGLFAGVVGTVVVLPFVYACSVLAEYLYAVIGYEHPAGHDLLLKLNETGVDTWVRRGLILSAIVAAPIFEELFFRGHVQSLLTAAFTRRARRRAGGPGFPVAPVMATAPGRMAPGDAVPASYFDRPLAALAAQPDGPAAPAPVLEYTPSIPLAQRSAPTWPRWAAILVTAVLFSLVHAAWTAPPIFVLAVALGYAYERTGSLWTVIVMHALFNAASTTAYLYMSPG